MMKNALKMVLVTAAALTLLLPQAGLAEEQKPMSLEELSARSCHGAPVQVSLGSSPMQGLSRAGESGESVGGSLSRIENGPCSWCTENSNCSQDCIDSQGNQSDCGDHGVCDACREALVEIGRTTVAQRADDPFYFTCEFRWWYLVDYKSVNLSTCQVYTFCERETTTSHSTGYTQDCCQYIAGGCFGQTC